MANLERIQKVADRVVTEPFERRRREALMHPKVRESREALIARARAVGAPGVIVLSLTQLAFTIGIVAIAAWLILLSIFFRKTVEVSWYVSEKVVRRRRSRLRVILILAMAAIVLMVLLGATQGPQLISIPLVIATVALILGQQGRHPLRVVGQHNELLLVSGFSRAFATEALKLVSAWEKRQFEGTLKTVIPAPE